MKKRENKKKKEEEEEEEKRENQKIAELLDDHYSRKLGMALLGVLDIDRITRVVDSCKMEDDQKIMIVLWFGRSIEPVFKPYTGSRDSWRALKNSRKVKHYKPHLSDQLIPERIIADGNRSSQNRHRSGMQRLGLIPYKDWDDDIYSDGLEKIAELLLDSQSTRLGYAMLQHLSDGELFKVLKMCGRMNGLYLALIVRSMFQVKSGYTSQALYWDTGELIRTYHLGISWRRKVHGIPAIDAYTEDLGETLKLLGINEL